MKEPIDEWKERADIFIRKLDKWESANKPEYKDRAAMAALRSGFGRRPGQPSRMDKYVMPYLSEGNDQEKEKQDRWFYLVGALYAYHPENRRGQSFGASMRPLRERSDSIEQRFLALLTSHSNDVYKYLSQAVSLLKTEKIPVDYFKLLDDLSHWNNPGRRVQMRWARDFYPRVQDEADITPINAEENTTNEN